MEGELEEMKLVRNVVVVAVATLFAGACTDFHRPGVAFMPVPNSYVQGTFADLELGSEVEGEASASCLFGFINLGAPNKVLDENPKEVADFSAALEASSHARVRLLRSRAQPTMLLNPAAFSTS